MSQQKVAVFYAHMKGTLGCFLMRNTLYNISITCYTINYLIHDLIYMGKDFLPLDSLTKKRIHLKPLIVTIQLPHGIISNCQLSCKRVRIMSQNSHQLASDEQQNKFPKFLHVIITY